MFLGFESLGRLGRALLRAFSRRQHEYGRTALNPQLLAAIKVYMSNLRSLKLREIPISLADRLTCVSYSDGEGESAGVGIALWWHSTRAVAGYIRAPPEGRNVQSRTAVSGDHYDFAENEAVGAALILHNFDHLMEDDALWVHLF